MGVETPYACPIAPKPVKCHQNLLGPAELAHMGVHFIQFTWVNGQASEMNGNVQCYWSIRLGSEDLRINGIHHLHVRRHFRQHVFIFFYIWDHQLLETLLDTKTKTPIIPNVRYLWSAQKLYLYPDKLPGTGTDVQLGSFFVDLHKCLQETGDRSEQKKPPYVAAGVNKQKGFPGDIC